MGHVIVFKTHGKGSRLASLVHVLESRVNFPKPRSFPPVCDTALCSASPLPGRDSSGCGALSPSLSVFQLTTSLNERHGLFIRCPNYESIAGCTQTCADRSLANTAHARSLLCKDCVTSLHSMRTGGSSSHEAAFWCVCQPPPQPFLATHPPEHTFTVCPRGPHRRVYSAVSSR